MKEINGIFDKLESEKGGNLTNSEKLNVLNLLDLQKSQNGFYLDAFGKEVSYNGIATLKRQYVKLPLSQTHIDEITKCSQDLFYFVRNYCKILTKSGIEFPEFREYQTQFLETLASGDDVIASLPRQSGKSVTSGLYILWKALFTPNINIGIAANKLSLAMEVLDKVKKVFLELPIWLQQGVVAWNKTYIELENGTRIMTSATNSDAFRGFSCIEKDEVLEVYDCKDEKFKYFKISELYEELKNDSFEEKNFTRTEHNSKRKKKNEKLRFTKQFFSRKKWERR